MKTTYPPNTANNEQDWENYAKSTLNHWYTHVYTLRDDPKLLDYAKKERQLFALQKRLATGTVKNYFALKNKIKKLQEEIKKQKEDNAWDNFLAQ